MKASYVLTLGAVLALIFGLAFVLVPAQTLALYDVELEPAGILVARLLGASFLVFAVTNWLVRNAGPTRERQAIILGLFVGEAVGFVVSLLAQLDGIANSLGWLTVDIYLVLTLGFGYVYFVGESGDARAQMAR
jgi:uncharacterized PurR-regulated membrane protein YhhQ (DUF165 family)